MALTNSSNGESCMLVCIACMGNTSQDSLGVANSEFDTLRSSLELAFQTAAGGDDKGNHATTVEKL